MCFFVKFGIAVSGFSLDAKPKLHKLGVFEETILRSTNCKFKCFSIKNGVLVRGNNSAKIWYRESQIFEVWQVHVRFWRK